MLVVLKDSNRECKIDGSARILDMKPAEFPRSSQRQPKKLLTWLEEKFKSDEADGRTVSVRDITLDGIRILSETALNIDEVHEIEILIASLPAHVRIRVHARVRTSKHEADDFVTDLAFTDLTDEGKSDLAEILASTCSP